MTPKFNHLSTRPELTTALQSVMCTDSIDDFVENCHKLLRSAMPVHSLCISFGRLDHSSPRLIRDTLPIRADADYINERYLLLNPSRPFLQQNLGARQSVLEDQLRLMADPDRESYLQRFQHHEGWSKYAEIYFWNERELQAIICVRRSATQRDFTASDLRFLAEVREALAPAVNHLNQRHQDRVTTACLQQVLAGLPIGLLILNWDLEPVSFNGAAKRACAEWKLGCEAARAIKLGGEVDIPAEILAACRAEKAAMRPEGFSRTPGSSPRSVTVSPLVHRHLVAHIELIRAHPDLIGRPHFYIRFQPALTLENETTREPTSNRALSALAGLTPCEREIALLVADGLSNREIALRLSREVATVKMHLRAVFKKLNVSNRTRIAVLIAAP